MKKFRATMTFHWRCPTCRAESFDSIGVVSSLFDGGEPVLVRPTEAHYSHRRGCPDPIWLVTSTKDEHDLPPLPLPIVGPRDLAAVFSNPGASP